MKFLHTEIGSAKDNNYSSVHNWYRFTAGFSHKFVDEIIKLEKLNRDNSTLIFDAFAGCGTTLVSAQKAGVKAIGNEAQHFMYEIIKAKLNWKIDKPSVESHKKSLLQYITENKANYDLSKVAHPLLSSLYQSSTLEDLYLIRDYVNSISSTKYKLFLKLALSQTLHKVSLHPIAVPYIVRSKTLSNKESVWDVFSIIVDKMLNEITELKDKKSSSKIYFQDSRIINRNIKSNSCSVCITSPPYLNNLDYGEVSKVHTHFFGETKNWNDITKKVRKKLVTGSTTHYMDSDFTIASFKESCFYKENRKIADYLIKHFNQIKEISLTRSGRKSFHILMLLYFQDMYKVLIEIKRVLKPNGKAYIILGDSAPYGIHIPTTRLLGQVAKNAGFESYRIYKLRTRGKKWKDLKYRHSIELSENVLVLR